MPVEGLARPQRRGPGDRGSSPSVSITRLRGYSPSPSLTVAGNQRPLAGPGCGVEVLRWRRNVCRPLAVRVPGSCRRLRTFSRAWSAWSRHRSAGF